MMVIVVESSNCMLVFLAFFFIDNIYRDALNGGHFSIVFHMKITKFLDQGNEVLGDQFTGRPQFWKSGEERRIKVFKKRY